jgi:photosystem II stability/assembly factor-like uncharacterized protein
MLNQNYSSSIKSTNKMRYFTISVIMALAYLCHAQQIVKNTSVENPPSTWQQSLKNSLVANISAENIGPTIFNGRVADIDVNPTDPTEFYVAYASGGLWHTNNNGTTFTPLFQHESVITIGDIAVDWQTGIIYLGSGEQNSSRSSYAGNGIYKSTDKGKTWMHLGLDETHHISKVIIHPTDVNTLWVAALGHLYSKNPERGVYKSTDGGKTWKLTLHIDEDTGASDIIIHPEQPKILYVATWQRSRRAWNFKESGSGSGIYKSSDGGESWSLISGPNSGFIYGEGTGRIGLDIAVKDGKDYIYAVVDNNNKRPKKDEKKVSKALTTESLKTMTKDDFLKLSEDDLNTFLKNNSFPDKYPSKKIKEMVAKDQIKVIDIAQYNNTANNALFETPIVGAEVYVSTNQGSTWQKTHTEYLDDVYFTYGYYFGQIRVQKDNPENVYIFGVPILHSKDGGKTWKNIDGDNVHSDHHALWLNPKKPGHLINGNDGGVNISYDNGASWLKCVHPEVGQFYYVNTDNNEPYQVYGGAQDNGVWMGSHQYKNSTRWQSSGDYPYQSILGGDGMQVQIDNRDNATIYAGFQFGNYFRINRLKKDRSFITPKHDLGKKPYRWNWQTPILLSPHNQDILYMGSNILLRSMNQGKDFVEISPDLTKGSKEGDVPFGTITSIDESKIKFGVIYAGSDDGLVHVTLDGGFSWKNISPGLPQDLWVSRVQASAHDLSTVYVTLNGYRNDHFKAYVYTSTDYGSTWKNIASNLPDEAVNVIKEDPFDENILYVGTDHGLYISLDKGTNYMSVGSMPRVPVHDVAIQQKSKHLIVGTHGRSIYKLDITNLSQIIKRSGEHLIVFKIADMRYSDRWGKKSNAFSDVWVPKVTFECFSDQEKQVQFEITSSDDVIFFSKPIQLKKGLATYEEEIKIDRTKNDQFLKSVEKADWVKKNGLPTPSDDRNLYPVPGKYFVRMVDGQTVAKTELNIK